MQGLQRGSGHGLGIVVEEAHQGGDGAFRVEEPQRFARQDTDVRATIVEHSFDLVDDPVAVEPPLHEQVERGDDVAPVASIELAEQGLGIALEPGLLGLVPGTPPRRIGAEALSRDPAERPETGLSYGGRVLVEETDEGTHRVGVLELARRHGGLPQQLGVALPQVPSHHQPHAVVDGEGDDLRELADLGEHGRLDVQARVHEIPQNHQSTWMLRRADATDEAPRHVGGGMDRVPRDLVMRRWMMSQDGSDGVLERVSDGGVGCTQGRDELEILARPHLGQDLEGSDPGLWTGGLLGAGLEEGIERRATEVRDAVDQDLSLTWAQMTRLFVLVRGAGQDAALQGAEEEWQCISSKVLQLVRRVVVQLVLGVQIPEYRPEAQGRLGRLVLVRPGNRARGGRAPRREEDGQREREPRSRSEHGSCARVGDLHGGAILRDAVGFYCSSPMSQASAGCRTSLWVTPSESNGLPRLARRDGSIAVLRQESSSTSPAPASFGFVQCSLKTSS